MSHRDTTKSQTRVWRAPLLLALVTLAGLLIALTGGEQPWRGIAWVLLSAPLAVGGVHYSRFPRKRRR